MFRDDDGKVQAISNRCLHRFAPLHMGNRGTYWHLESNGQYLVNYGWRYRRGMPISSSIAESAVNEVVSLWCAKKRQMRWANKGHTCSFRFAAPC